MDELRNAVEADDLQAAKDILQSNKNIHLNMRIGNEYDYTTLLILACEKGCTGMVELLTLKQDFPADVKYA